MAYHHLPDSRRGPTILGGPTLRRSHDLLWSLSKDAVHERPVQVRGSSSGLFVQPTSFFCGVAGMLIAVQFPIADLRPFLSDDRSHAQPRPQWRNGKPHEFVRCGGVIRRDVRKSLEHETLWSDEKQKWLKTRLPHWTYDTTYCDAGAALLLPDLGKSFLGQHKPSFAFRRLFSDGKEHVRFEIGLFLKGGLAEPLSSHGVWRLIQDFMRLPTRVVEYDCSSRSSQRNYVERKLLSQNNALANFYANSTLVAKHRVPNPDRAGLVAVGKPVILIEYLKAEISDWDDHWHRLDPAKLCGINLGYFTKQTDGNEVTVWLLESDPRTTASRNVRLCVFQAHAEREILKRVIGAFSLDDFAKLKAARTNELRAYLTRSQEMLEVSNQYGCQVDEIHALLDQWDVVKSPGTSASLKDDLCEILGHLQNTSDRKAARCKVLFLACGPDNLGRLALDKECHDIEEGIRQAKYRDAIVFLPKFAVQRKELQLHLIEEMPHVLHFSGHGSTDQIAFMEANGIAAPVSQAGLKSLLTALKGNIRLVVLNACYTQQQADSITDVIDCAIGMSRAIGDEAARVFSASFYLAVGFGCSIKNAYDQAIASLQVMGIPEDKTPVLSSREGVDPDKVFLVVPEENSSNPK